MKLVSINVEFDKHHDTVLPFLKSQNPDVVCLQELLDDDVEFFKGELGMQCAFQTCRYDKFPRDHRHLGVRHGVGIFAKEIQDQGYAFYAGEEKELFEPFKFENPNNAEAIVWADVEGLDGKTYRILTCHFPVTHEGESTPYQLEVLDTFLTKVEPLGECVITGDFNAPRGNETFSRLAQKYKDNIPAEYKTTLDPKLHPTKGLIEYVVDGLFTTPAYSVSDIKLVDGLSDHVAVVGEVVKD
jgi:exonuclease III